MVAGQTVVLRRIGADRADEVAIGRFLANAKVTVAAVLEGWSRTTASAAAGRHVLAIQDSSELCFTTAAQRRQLGKIGRGAGHGLILHAMLAAEAATGAVLGLVAGQIFSRDGTPKTPHRDRPLAERESLRWLTTARTAQTVLVAAACVTVVADRESDLYAEWAHLPAPNFHLLTRAAQDRRLAGSGKLFQAAQAWPAHGERTLTVPSGSKALRQPRSARVSVRFGPVTLCRPRHETDRSLPEQVTLRLVEVREIDPPAGAPPVLWRLLTTHEVPDAAAAWQIVDWYRQRWLIEQLFRLLKQQGLNLEASQVATADSLKKLVAIAARAAVVSLQLVQARDGTPDQPASAAFTDREVAVLTALGPTLEGKTPKQKNPHRPHSLAWAAWIIARLGGWKGYACERPPGPITCLHGLRRFFSIVQGDALRDVCIP